MMIGPFYRRNQYLGKLQAYNSSAGTTNAIIPVAKDNEYTIAVFADAKNNTISLKKVRRSLRSPSGYIIIGDATLDDIYNAREIILWRLGTFYTTLQITFGEDKFKPRGSYREVLEQIISELRELQDNDRVLILYCDLSILLNDLQITLSSNLQLLLKGVMNVWYKQVRSNTIAEEIEIADIKVETFRTFLEILLEDKRAALTYILGVLSEKRSENSIISEYRKAVKKVLKGKTTPEIYFKVHVLTPKLYFVEISKDYYFELDSTIKIDTVKFFVNHSVLDSLKNVDFKKYGEIGLYLLSAIVKEDIKEIKKKLLEYLLELRKEYEKHEMFNV